HRAAHAGDHRPAGGRRGQAGADRQPGDGVEGPATARAGAAAARAGHAVRSGAMTESDSEFIAPLAQESTPSIIADKLRQAIAHGHLETGAQLGEAELARRLGVSRGPL